MPITNKYGLPSPLVARLSHDTYVRRGDYSATELVGPAQVGALWRRYRDKVVEDAADLIWSVLGQSVHSILEDTPGFNYLREHSMIVDFDGAKISMTPDLYDIDTCRLWDYKVTSVYTVMDGIPKKDWVGQATIYAYGLAKDGYPVKDCKIIAILRDWSKLAALRDSRMPPVQVVVMDVWLPNLNEADVYISERLDAHRRADELSDEDLYLYSPCSDEETWADPNKWAVIKHGAKRAYRLCDSQQEAEALMSEKGYTSATHRIDFRPGLRKRCEYYCGVNKFCHQYKAYKGE